jgi:hypothetical protein
MPRLADDDAVIEDFDPDLHLKVAVAVLGDLINEGV